ncbi:hypothetical protein [Vibrio spartinae]|uniref:Uncharacterized protein n=1 Tax=Vibrio spartinae TaxID=1918945 RepID=A0A1N6M534_9VIBR|nr:hypothetical protein [Vibrio spartinae]QMV15037.1 hypothetical protein Vspart_02315 [Vibrio spartinae]SIO94563.1 hypothetical protein VSP9026_02288 [Vibrio spartinae]
MRKYKAKVIHINPEAREEITFDIHGSIVQCFLGHVPSDIRIGKSYFITFAFLDEDFAEQFGNGIPAVTSEHDDSIELSLSIGDAPMGTEYASLNGKAISIQLEPCMESSLV